MTAGRAGSTRADSPSSTSSKPGSTLVPPGATRPRISDTASTASRSTSTESSSQLAGAGRRALAKLVADLAQERSAVADRLVGGDGVGVEGLALGLREVGGHRDVDDDVEIAPDAAPAEVGHAPAAQPDLRSGLRAGLDLDDLVVAADRRDGDACPEGRLGQPDRGLVDQLRAVALQSRMRRNVDGDVEAARRPAVAPDLALVRQPDLVALVDAGRDRDAQAPLPLDAALALAGLAGRLDDRPVAPTARARRDVDHLAEHRLADAADLTATVALRAGRRCRAGLRAAPGARLAAGQDRELDLLLGPENRVLEGDPEVVAQVRAAGRTSSPRRGRVPPEERVEDVGEAAEARRRVADVGRAEQVIALPALGVGQDLVGLVDLLEPLLGSRVLVHVRMPLLGEAPERLLDVRVARTAFDAEHRVVVEGGHRRKDTGDAVTIPAWTASWSHRSSDPGSPWPSPSTATRSPTRSAAAIRP